MIVYDDYGRRYRTTNAAQPDAVAVYAWFIMLWLCFGLFFITRFTVRVLIRIVRALRQRRAARLAYHRQVLAEHEAASGVR